MLHGAHRERGRGAHVETHSLHPPAVRRGKSPAPARSASSLPAWRTPPASPQRTAVVRGGVWVWGGGRGGRAAARRSSARAALLPPAATQKVGVGQARTHVRLLPLAHLAVRADQVGAQPLWRLVGKLDAVLGEGGWVGARRTHRVCVRPCRPHPQHPTRCNPPFPCLPHPIPARHVPVAARWGAGAPAREAARRRGRA